ncbi:amino acid ABC transporter permease [Streptococcus dysgalactiae]|uniref:amino acid ABC transporter permease n=2 Tax=Streptococcus dysgalactiae TaxID=1334 RepID=UPI0001F866B8|nr:amino acid ABC transporter permease [Streptococcus dysgalactiae]EFY02827.1 cystine transport system permease protein [Streptococcus dysgalactiae subsp. dysgalactiae ATCC 27957]MCB2830071.1 amino acid ABC transporter permease [Streptococcus dysgalactiae subsp. dysgalactiae]MCB2832207.1 amino acid ABC transporter permease [Streptococcus dysgalactiae subsp. dysgalactiae]MCB2833977.1 amino acid ABC transporter permease [Streptococcus dysgalactiae subsp. dysgalactiae]MCB2835851.1 amino acid ABC 
MINIWLMKDSLGFVLSGLPYTLGISLLSFVTGLLLGLGLALLGRSRQRLIHYLVRAYISIMRGVPMIVVLFVLYFGLPYYGLELPALLCAYLGFSMVSAAYISEVFRSSIEAIDKGQWEAAKALGLPYSLMVKKIILPQAFRIAVPPLGNVIIDMVKSSSLAAMITVPDIFQNSKIIGGREWDYMSMYILVAFIYWLIAFLLERYQEFLENKLALV